MRFNVARGYRFVGAMAFLGRLVPVVVVAAFRALFGFRDGDAT